MRSQASRGMVAIDAYVRKVRVPARRAAGCALSFTVKHHPAGDDEPEITGRRLGQQQADAMLVTIVEARCKRHPNSEVGSGCVVTMPQVWGGRRIASVLRAR